MGEQYVFIFQSNVFAYSCFLSRSRSSMELDGELFHGDGEIFHSEGSTIASSAVGREDGSVGPVIYVYLGQAERR